MEMVMEMTIQALRHRLTISQTTLHNGRTLMATDMEIIKHMEQLRQMISSMRPHNGLISMEMDMETIHWA